MRVKVLRAVRRAQAAVRAREPGWRDLAADLLLVHECGGPGEARRAAGKLVAWVSSRRASRPSA
jgi:hypothetical protein